MTDDQLQYYINEIQQKRAQADALGEDSPGVLVEKITLLTTVHMYMGRVSAQMDGDYARLYTLRKNTYVKAKKEAPRGDKTLAAEEAIMKLRELEDDAYERKMIWHNELNSVKEKIYELRMRVRIETHIAGGGAIG